MGGSSEQEWWDSKGNDGKKGTGHVSAGWAIWRTAAELMNLHAALVCSFNLFINNLSSIY